MATQSRRRAAGARSAQPSPAEIAARAYELYVRRGRQHGHDLEDWLAAERELMAEHARADLESA